MRERELGGTRNRRVTENQGDREGGYRELGGDRAGQRTKRGQRTKETEKQTPGRI
jgi:hypothetical protein